MNYFYNKYLNNKGNKGFTLVELIIVMALFLLITGASFGIFISVIKSQRTILAEQQFLNQISYVNEYMSKALRMARTAETSACIPEGYIYVLTKRDTVSGLFQGIKFLASDGLTCQQFLLGDDGSLKEIRGNNSEVSLTSTNNFKINSVRFSINGSDGSAGFCSNKDQCGAAYTDTVQPRVTILFNVTVSNESPKTIQTTISQRNLNVDYGQRYQSITPSIFPSGWEYYRPITIAASAAGTLENFPVLVQLTSANFSDGFAKSSAYDIRFATKNGENLTLLKHERVSWDGINKFAEFWVRIPYISSSSPTEIYLYYGNSTAGDSSTMAAVWDSINYKGVWHENDATIDTISDSTYYGNNGDKSPINSPTEVDGKIGKAQSFNGVDNYITIPDKYSLEIGGPFTLSGWVRATTPNKDTNWLFGKWQDANDSRSYAMWFWDNGSKTWDQATLGVSDTGLWVDSYKAETSYTHDNPDVPSLADGSWHYVSGVYDGANMSVYVDGVQRELYISSGVYAETRTGPASINKNSSSFMMGAYDNKNFLKGILDEVRISDVARSASWIKGEYSYGGGDNTSVTVGVEILP